MSAIDELIIRMRTIGATTVAGEVGQAERGIGSLGQTAKTAAGVAGLAGLAFGIKDITQAAMTFQTQTNQLNQALRNTGQFSAENSQKLITFADQLSTHGGYDPSTTLTGIQRLIAAHDTVTQAIKDETLATDMARSGQTSYTTAVRTLSIVEQGRTTGLARLGINIPPVKTAEDALTQSRLNSANSLRTLAAEGVKMSAQQRAQFELNHQITPQMVEQAKAADVQATKVDALRVMWHRFGGQVAAFSGSPQGAIENFRHSIDVLAQRLGAFLLPVITALAHLLIHLADVLGGVVNWFEKNKWAADLLKGAVITLITTWGLYKLGLLSALATTGEAISAFGVMGAAEYGLITATGLLAAAWDALVAASPLIIVMALVAVIYLLITHFEAVKHAAVDAWHWVEQAASDAFAWIKAAVTDARQWITAAWSSVLHILSFPFVQAAHFISGVWDGVKAGFSAFIDWLGHTFSSIGKFLANPIIDALNFVIRGIDWLIQRYNDVVGLIPGIGGDLTIGLVPQIPRLATGGTIMQGGLVMVGEHGPEPVLLPTGAQVYPHSPAGTGGGVPLENTVVLKIGEWEFARAITRSLASVKATS